MMSVKEIEIENVLAAVVEVRKNDIKKLHHVYGHVAAGKLKHFLEKAGFSSKEITQLIDEISKTCDACIKTKRRNPRPKSALPRVEGPNEIITVDLKEFDRHSGKHRYICYLIDMHSRMTIGDFITEKKPGKVIDVVMRRWIQTFGMMKCLHSDIGGEMTNELMENVVSYLGVKLTTTCASSPHQNGINERNHATVDLMMTRMLESDRNLTPGMALSWALNAKNSLENCYGFSPFQLHIGYNPMLPSGTREGPPAMEGVTKSKTFSLHLNAIHAAREAFAHAESSSALKKALKGKIFPRGDDIEGGDWIYYKKDENKSNNKVRKGPSQVVATYGKKLFVDQGARLGTTNRDNAVRVGEEFWRIDDVEEEQKDSVSHEQDQKNDEDQVESVDGESRTEVVIDNDMLNRKEEEQQDVGEKNRPNENEAGYTHIDIKKNDIIRYKLPDSEWETVKILSRAGKATGKNKYWWNVEVLETGNSKSVNTENLEVLERVVNHVEIEEEIEEVLVVLIPRHLHDQPECIEAKEKELENWDNFGTYEEVEDVGQKTLNTNWVLVKKADGVKARLCVRGDQERDKEHIRTDSPTVHKSNYST